jgi:ribose transport system ATP-binding protein
VESVLTALEAQDPNSNDHGAGRTGAGISGPTALTVRQVSKTFQGQRALDRVDLEIRPGEVHALLGENGSGKSTLIKILSGFHRPDVGGMVEIGGQPLPHGSSDESARLGCRFVHQDLGLVETESVLDNLALGVGYPSRFGTIRRKAARKRAVEELDRVGLRVDLATPVANLTPSERTGVAIARALRAGASEPIKLLVFDEPTATMPADEVARLLDIIKATAALGVGVLYVTHRLDEVFGLAHHVTVLRDGRVFARRSTFDLTHADLVRLLVGTELEEVRRDSSEVAKHHGTEVRLTVKGMRAGKLRGVTGSARKGDVIGFAGLTGSGREALLSAIFGGTPRSAGEVLVDGHKLPPMRPDLAVRLGVAYLPPDRSGEGAAMRLTARENLTLVDLRPLWSWPLLRGRKERAEAKSWFEELGVRPAGAIEQPLESFSGGNQQKILFAKWLRAKPKVLLLDEPTQGVDLATRAELHRRILDSAAEGMTVLVSSADLDELAALCHRVLVLRDGKFVADLSGDEVLVEDITRAALGGLVEEVS